jgi:hypothetical protein
LPLAERAIIAAVQVGQLRLLGPRCVAVPSSPALRGTDILHDQDTALAILNNFASNDMPGSRRSSRP